MSDVLSRYWLPTVILFVAIVVAITVLVWRFTTEDDLASAQEAIEDACEGTAIFSSSYDVNVRITGTEGDEIVFEALGEERYNGEDAAWTATDSDGNIILEVIKIITKNDDTASGQGASGSSSTNRKMGSVYIREADDNGELGGWEMESHEVPSKSASGSSSDSAVGTASDTAAFCGFPLTSDGYRIEFRYVGEEAVNGILTKHYYHSYSPVDGPEENYNRTDFWIDSSNGRFVKLGHDTFVAGDSESEADSRRQVIQTYSGWGEENVITAPVLSTPTPAPELTATATPEPLSTPTSVPEPTATPSAAVER